MRWLGLAVTLLASAASGAALEPAPPGVDGRQLARRAADALHGVATYLEATLTISSPRLPKPREIALRAWDDPANRRSFVRILSPPDDAGTGFLELSPNLWMYATRIQRRLRIPPEMMHHPWMGSDFTHDDIFDPGREIRDYDHKLLGVDPGGEGMPRAYVVSYEPWEGVPAAWGRIVAWIEVEHGTPLRMEYFDAAGERMRELRFDDVRQVQGRRYPYRWTMTPLDAKAQQSRLEVREVRFEQTFDESIFTTGQLGPSR